MTEDKAGEKHAVEVPIVPDCREGTEVYVRPARCNSLYEIIGVVEMAIVTLNRALQMASQINSKFALSTPFPSSVVTKLKDIKAIRDAYEHIEDRAFGLVRGKPHPDALSVFNHVRLIEDRVVVYGSHELNIDDEATQLLIETRSYLMMIAKELS